MRGTARPAPSLGRVLEQRRRRLFVGREAEMELVRTALARRSTPTPFAVLYVHGPGGIGKTRLLDAIEDLATDHDTDVIRIDGRDADVTPDTIHAALRTVAEVPDDGSPITPRRSRLVLLLDSYERLRPLDRWVRTSLLPRLPDSAVTVIADRGPPDPGWRSEPGWDALLRVVSLRNLDPLDGRAFLSALGLEPARHDRALALSHGHPLALALLAEIWARDGDELGTDPFGPDVVGILLRRFLDAEPSSDRRRALEVCALARTTTEELLRQVLDLDDAHPVFEWLRSLSFIDVGSEGLFPNDLARDVLDADLRWRDPELYRLTFHRVWTSVLGRLEAPGTREQRQAIADLKFVFRNLPGVLSPVDWESWGQGHPRPAGPEDRDGILELVRRAEGPASADLAAFWLQRQPEGFFVLTRADGSVQGMLGLLDLSRASPADLESDPGTHAAWTYAQERAPSRPDETVTQTRFVIDSQAYQDPSPTVNATPVLTMQRYLCTRRLAWDFLTLAEPERWDEYFTIADLPRAVGADFVVDGRRFGLFAHDFRRVPVQAWLTRVADRGLARGHVAPVRSKDVVHVLSATEFEQAARRALQDLHRPDLLSRNVLLQSRIALDRSHGDPPGPELLAALVHEAIETLAVDPRDDKLLRAVHRTYRRPAATREAAAAMLGLPFSTYRRHLSQGTSRIVAWMWDQEVHGAAPARGGGTGI